MKKKLLVWGIVLLCLAIVGAGSALLLCRALRGPAPKTAADHVIAHVGGSGYAADYSFDAFDAVIADGITHIEQDVVISKDGTLYVCHDLTAQRLCGDARLFRDMTDGEIEALTTVNGNKFITLAAVFDRYKSNKSLTFVVELKDQSATEPFLALVEEQGLQRRCIVQSVNLASLKTCKTTLPFLRTLYLSKDQIDFNIVLSQYYIDIISLQQANLSAENVAAAHEAGKLFNTWVCDNEQEITNAILAGADTYFTNYPQQAMRLEKELRK